MPQKLARSLIDGAVLAAVATGLLAIVLVALPITLGHLFIETVKKN